MIKLRINHVFLGGNNPRTESEEIEGEIGEEYKIRNKSNVAYAIEDRSKSNGVFKEDETITISYNDKNELKEGNE